MNDIIPIFIGYDPREAIVFHVCANSIIRHSSTPVQIIPLSLNLLKDYKETHTDGSNAFIYSRFLVPYLRDFKGHAIYIDGDMVVKSDITELWNLRSKQYDVQVVLPLYSLFPVFGVLLTVLMLQEQVSMMIIIGGLIVVSGNYLLVKIK